jgi:Glycosyltransferase sugar-binding region containing DXD motif
MSIHLESKLVHSSMSIPVKKEEHYVEINTIPCIIYMCDKTLDNITIFSKNWTRLNPDYELRLYDNEKCESFLLTEFGQKYADVFRYIKDGPIKSDFWRVCVLYKYGGIYSDADNEPLVSLKDIIDPHVDFLTCSSYADDHKYNPNFIMAKKNDVFMKKAIDLYLQWYDEKREYDYWGWSIMTVFDKVLPSLGKEDGIYDHEGKRIQLFRECPGTSYNDAHNMYKGTRVFNNRYKIYDPFRHSFRMEYHVE